MKNQKIKYDKMTIKIYHNCTLKLIIFTVQNQKEKKSPPSCRARHFVLCMGTSSKLTFLYEAWRYSVIIDIDS